MDRSAINQALAKALAYVNAGKPAQAASWARKLIGLLREAGIDV